ncbi:MAG TPA: amidohydrolase family protein [Planctomycetota bacterium]|nr:amidohydrolase family protein [Planctomycetota bacterium]
MRVALLIAAAILLAPSAAQEQKERPLYKTAYRVINVHSHWDKPNEAAAKAEVDIMDAAGVTAEVNLDVGRSDGTLPEWMALRKKFSGRILLFTKFTEKDFERIREPGFFEGLVRELERSAKMGVQGVKIWKDLGMYIRDGSGETLKIDDPRLDPFWDKCGELGLPVLIHSADPKEYWYPLTYNSLHYGYRSEEDQHYKNPRMPRWEELIRERDSVVAKHPKTTFIGAHFGSMTFDLEELGARLDKYPNFHVECAARLRILGRLNPQAVRDFFSKYQDRILFGTDGIVLASGHKPGNGKNIVIYPVDDADLVRVDPANVEAVERWKERALRVYSRYFEYFETDRLDLVDPTGFAPDSLRLRGAKLPAQVLEKFYHANAERLIPSLAAKK